MRIYRPCFIARWVYPDAIFRINTTEKLLCITFDDGPDPSSTPVLLDILSKHNIKAHFFCNGNNAEKYPGLVEQIVSEGHITGNHSYSHINGWKSSVKRYIKDVENATLLTSGKWFRPPYGRLKLRQYLELKKKYRIIFWDLMPYDFDTSFTEEKSLKIIMKKLRPGSVIVLHDRSRTGLSDSLNLFIESAIKSGYRFVLME